MSETYDRRSLGASRHAEEAQRRRDRRSRSPDRKRRRRSEDVDEGRTHDGEIKAGKGSSSRRSRSPHKHREHRHRGQNVATAAPPAELPFGARQLTKGDLRAFEPLLGHYLELQKQRYIDDMDDREVRGRWKSFIGKWNRGELAEGWYDPDMYERIVASQAQEFAEEARDERANDQDTYCSPEGRQPPAGYGEDENEDNSDYGPTLPSSSRRGQRMGVAIPSRDDLALRDETGSESRDAARENLRAERRSDRKMQKERLDELLPRAEAGTRERKLEKKREVNDKMREFRDKSPGVMAAANDNELMGGGDSLSEYKQQKAQEQRRKTEREIRREELQRVKQAEIDEKRRKWQEREQGTMSMLQELARQRFG